MRSTNAGAMSGIFLTAVSMASTAREEYESPTGKNPGAVVSIFEEKSVLGTDGQFTIEPSLTYTHSTTTLVAVEGFSIVPALLVGLINVNQAQRDTLVSALALRYALSDRFQINVRVPYVSTEESVRERQAFEGSQLDIINNSSGAGLGDIEGSVQYQFNTTDAPFFTGSLRLKGRTGTSPFETERRLLLDPEGNAVGFVFTEQPTGSGFVSLQTGLSVVYPSDPAVLYWNVSYLWNRKRDLGSEFGGTIDPGDAIGFSFGIGFAINEQTSFSLGYEHSIIGRTRVEQDPSRLDLEFSRLQVGSLLMGINLALSNTSHLNMSVGIGVTDPSPDLQLTFRVPFTL